MLFPRSVFALALVLFPLALLGLYSHEPAPEEAGPRAPAAPVAAAAPSPAPPETPLVESGTRLVVVVSIDQFAYDYLPRFKQGYDEQGFFRRVEREGANYTHCHHRHAFTITAPGHSVQLTGTYPAQTGIVGNNWYDRKVKKLIYCVDDEDFPLVGRPAAAGSDAGVTKTGQKKPDGVSARRLLVPTVGEELQKQRPGAKLCGVALKDRAAVLMCGHKADAVVWFDETTGSWVTSTYYHDRLPDYVAAYNKARRVGKFTGETWSLLKPLDQYRLSYPDDVSFEGVGYGLGRAFPHKLSNVAKEYYTQVALTPFGNDLTLEMVREVIVHEGLGKDETPDLLCVNFSSNDYCGHNYGPDSLEVEDMCYRTDLQLARLTTWLDELVGQDRWTMLITADHAVAPIAEYAKSRGLPGDRNALGGTEKLRLQLNKHLAQRFGPAQTVQGPIVDLQTSELVLNEAEPLVQNRRAEVETLLVEFLAKHEGIDTVFSRRQIAAGVSNGSPLFEAFRKTCHPQFSGDILWCLKPYRYQSSTGTTHGSPWPYDSHVPLLLLGRGIKPGIYERETSPAAVAATVARLLGIRPPKTCIERGAEEALAVGK